MTAAADPGQGVGARRARAYNPRMLQALVALVAPATMQRVTLLLNHVLRAEPAAMQRLAVHRGRTLQVEVSGWPPLLPPPPRLAFAITPAGLLEWKADEGTMSDLSLRVDASNPAGLAAGFVLGEPPTVEVVGDAALATDVSWVIDHVRWDIEADLERLLGPRVAHELARAGAGLAGALREALRRGADALARLRPGSPGERAGP